MTTPTPPNTTPGVTPQSVPASQEVTTSGFKVSPGTPSEFKLAGTPAWHRYRKFAVALLGLVLTAALQFAPQSHYTVAAVAVATAFGVWRVPNAA